MVPEVNFTQCLQAYPRREGGRGLVYLLVKVQNHIICTIQLYSQPRKYVLIIHTFFTGFTIRTQNAPRDQR